MNSSAEAGQTKAAKQDPETASTENQAVKKAKHLSARLVYRVVLREGEDELARPNTSLVFSGIAAGVCIAFSVIGEAIFRSTLPDGGVSFLVENLGYSLGFLLVILSRLQLFTENTITTVMPVLTLRSLQCLVSAARLWGIVLAANIVGCFIAGAFLALTPVFGAPMQQAFHELATHATSAGVLDGFFKAIPAGLLVAALVWMLAAGERSEAVLTILIFTWLIAAGDFTHIIAGSVEMAYLLVLGDLGWVKAIFGFFMPVLAGNVIGGTAVFTLLAWGQVREEIAKD